MNQNVMLKPALIGGVLLGILSAVPPLSLFNCLCCAWVIGGGILAASLYVKNSPTAVTLGTGMLLGLLTGAIGGAVSVLFSIPIQMLMSSMGMWGPGEMRQMLSELNLPPEWRDMLESIMSNSGGPHIALMVFAGLMNVVVYSLVATLGGVLGVAIFEKRKVQGSPPSYPPPINLPPPPPPPPEQ
jgi:hypothetical protein